MSIFCVFFTLLTLFVLSVCILQTPIETKALQSSQKCIFAIANRYFIKRPTVSIFTTSIKKDTSVLDEIYRSTYHVKKFMNYSTFNMNFAYGRKKYGILIGDSLDDFINSSQIDKLSLWNARAKFIFYSSKNSENLLQKFTDSMWYYYIINAIILMPSKDNKEILNIYSWFPYEGNQCGENISAQLIDKCIHGTFQLNLNLFPSKVPNDLHMCPVRVRVLIWPPFVLLPEDNQIIDDVPLNIKEGIEVKMTKTIAEALNFKILFYTSTIPHDWGLATLDGNTTGAIKALREKKADLAMGSFGPTTERRMYCDHSVCHLQEALTWCVPKAHESPRWKNLLQPFQIVAWLSIITTYLFVSICIWYFSYCSPKDISSYKKINNSFMFMYSIFFGLSARETPKKISGRITFFIWLIFGVHFSVAYQAKLIGVLLQPNYEHQISTIDEILNSDMEYQILPTHRRFYANTDDWKVAKIIDEWTSCEDSDACLRRVAYERNFALCTLKAHAQFEALQYRDNKGQSLVHCIDYVTYASELYMTKGFPLKDHIDKLIYRIRNSGLMFKWQRDLERIWLYRFRSFTDGDNRQQILTVAHMQGAFAVLIFGLSISIISFVSELLISILLNHSKIYNVIKPFRKSVFKFQKKQ